MTPKLVSAKEIMKDHFGTILALILMAALDYTAYLVIHFNL